MSNKDNFVKAITLLSPKTVLDVGIGNGEFTALIRQILDINHGRVKKDTWETIICGMVNDKDKELYSPYWDYFTTIEFENKLDFDRLSGFDLVIVNTHTDYKDSTKTLKKINRVVWEVE